MGQIKQNILFNFRGGIGDFLMATPLLKSLKKDGRYSLIFMGIEKDHKNLIANYDYFDKVLFFNCPGPEQLKYYIFQVIALYFRLKKRKIGVCINPITTYGRIPALISRFSGAPVTISFDHGSKTVSCTELLRIDTTKTDVELNMEVLDILKVKRQDSNADFFLRAEDIREAEDWLRSKNFNQGQKIISIAPLIKGMPGYAPRNWELKRFVELAKRVLVLGNRNVVIFGSPDEIRELKNREEIRECLANQNIFLLDGPLSLGGAAAILRKSDLVICNDGGVLHMAAALDVPIVSIWGPTKPARKGYVHKDNFVAISKNNCECWREYNLPPVECQYGQKCLAEISVDEVFGACKNLLQKTAS